MTEPIPFYRFMDSDGALKSLVAGKFRVGLVSKFNDPFEWRLGFAGMSTPAEQAFAENFSAQHLAWLETWMGILNANYISKRLEQHFPSFRACLKTAQRAALPFGGSQAATALRR